MTVSAILRQRFYYANSFDRDRSCTQDLPTLSEPRPAAGSMPVYMDYSFAIASQRRFMASSLPSR